MFLFAALADFSFSKFKTMAQHHAYEHVIVTALNPFWDRGQWEEGYEERTHNWESEQKLNVPLDIL